MIKHTYMRCRVAPYDRHGVPTPLDVTITGLRRDGRRILDIEQRGQWWYIKLMTREKAN